MWTLDSDMNSKIIYNLDGTCVFYIHTNDTGFLVILRYGEFGHFGLFWSNFKLFWAKVGALERYGYGSHYAVISAICMLCLLFYVVHRLNCISPYLHPPSLITSTKLSTLYFTHFKLQFWTWTWSLMPFDEHGHVGKTLRLNLTYIFNLILNQCLIDHCVNKAAVNTKNHKKY